MMKVFIGLAVFVWAFYSHAADCRSVETKVSSKTKLYRDLNTKSPSIINDRFERKGSIEQVIITEQCSNKLIVRYQTDAQSLTTGKTAAKKYFCQAEVSLKNNDILKARCLAPKNENGGSSNYEDPRAYPYGDVGDPFSNNNSNSGPRYGEEDPDYPSRNNDGPDSTDTVLF